MDLFQKEKPANSKLLRFPRFSISHWSRLHLDELGDAMPRRLSGAMTGSILSLKAFTVIATYLIVIVYHLGQELNPISNYLGVTPYMLSSAVAVCIGSFAVYRWGPKTVAFLLLYGLFVVTVADATFDFISAIRIISVS
jgi:hypothetical protein